MSTIAPPSKPLSPALVDSEHYIDDQIRRTRRALKLVDLAAGLITLAIGLLAFVLLAALLDHWVVPGGLNEAGRLAVFGLMLVALAWYGWRQFVPLLRSINPVYAAHTIERSTPTLKNSLLNLLLFRTHRQHMSARVYHALEQQAAQRLSTAPVDASIDRTALLRLGYALLLIIAVCAVYSVLSPKNMAVSVARVLAPWADLQAPSRVHIMNIRPGDISVARGERLEVEATIDGLRADDAVRVRYSTTDEQLVDESVAMKTPDPNIGRFTAELPRKDAAAGAAGVEQDFVYWIEAGDAKSKKFNVTVFSRPTIIVQKVRYEYPAYTGFPSTDVENTGDIRGLEGTRVTISALANQPIKSAYIDFDADGRSDLRMTAEGDRAAASFTLGLREDRRTPKHISYMLKFTTVEGRANIDPPKYRIDVTPDYAPEVRITAPEEPELTVRVDETVPISVEARDPDFALSGVRLMGKVGDREATLAELLSKRLEGRFGAIKPFTPGDVRLKAGDVLEYWAEARDNRRPEANVAASEHRRLKIAGPADQQAKPPAGGQQGPPQNGKVQQGEPASAGGQQGQGSEQQQGNDAGGNGEGGEESQGQQGPGGAGAQGEQNDNAQGEQGAGGQGQSGQSQPSDAQQETQGQGGGSSANNADPSQNPQQQPTNGANNGAGKAGEPQNGQQQPGDPASQPGESASADGQQGEQQPGDPGAQVGETQTGNPQDAQPGAQQAAPQEKVSSQGDEDSTAFQRMAEHLNKQSGEQSANQQGKSAPGESASAEGQQREQSQQPQTGAEQKSGEAASRTQGQQGAAGNSASQKPSAQQEGADPAGLQENPANQAEQSGANASPPDKSSNAAGQSKNANNQKPTAEGAQPNEPRQPSGDAQQQQPQGAGQDENQRQGADMPRESKPGDGNPQDNQGAQQPSAESNVSNNQSDAGAGHNSDEQQGTASTFDKRAADKQNEGDRNKKLKGDEEPPSGSDSKRESDSDGGQSGDQSGGGQEGAGQHADAPGKGAQGQNEAADTGGGRADEQGQGETGSKAGSDQVAEGKTGQSSGDQKGQGSQQGKAGEQSKAGESDSTAGEPASAGGQKQQPPGDQGPQNQSGEQSADSQSADMQSAQGEPASAGGQQGKGGEQSSEQSEGGQSASSQPQGGGPGGAATASGQQLTEEAKEDEANLKFAREQTDLVLERLDEQLAKKQVDANLLKSLGWSEEELRQFVGRWKNLKTRAERPGDDASEARDELDDALRSLGLRPQGPTRVRASAKADKLRVNDSYRARAPIEYADRVRLYSKNIASGEDE